MKSNSNLKTLPTRKLKLKSGRNLIEVDACLVGGEQGVFAVYQHPRGDNLIGIASGDDGNWWEISVLDRYWISGLIKALSEV